MDAAAQGRYGPLLLRPDQKLRVVGDVHVLPGRLLAREVAGHNPGAGRIRMALVAPVAECLEAAHRIVSYTESLS